MVSRVTQPTIVRPITDGNGTMSLEFQSWVQVITNRSLIIGTGSPETIVPATQGSAYMDVTGTTGTLLYLKRDADIAGDDTKGWMLV